MASRLTRRLRTAQRDVRSALADGIGSLASRLGAQITEKAFDDIGPAEFGFATDSIEGETEIAAGQLAGVYERHLFTHTCVSYIARSLAQMPLKFYKRSDVGGDEQLDPADDHPIARAFRWWNPTQSHFEAVEWMSTWLMLGGTSYTAKLAPSEIAPAGIPFELWPLFSPAVRVMRDPIEGVVGYKYRLHGMEKTFLPSEMVAVRCFSTDIRFSGMGPIFAGRQEILTDQRARQWNDRLLKNGVHIVGTISSESEDILPKQASRIEQLFMRKFSRSGAGPKVMVLHSGLKFTPQTLAHKDILWIEQLKMTKEDIAEAFGVPMELLGQKSANFASLQEKRRLFWQDTVMGWARRIESTLNETFLAVVAPGLVCYFDTNDVDALQANTGDLVKNGEVAIRSGQYTINEWRTKHLGLEPIAGGDVLMIGRGIVPLSVALSEAARSDEAPADVRRAVRLIGSSEVASKADDDYLRAIDGLRTKAERRLELAARQHMRAVEAAVNEAIDVNGISSQLVKEVEHIIVVDKGGAYAASTADELRAIANQAGTVVHQAVGITGAFDIRNTAAEQILGQQKKRIKDIGRRQWNDLRGSLQEALAQGESEQGMKKRVSQFFQGERSNALTIARTETATSVNSAQWEALKGARDRGIELRARWNTVIDDRTRPDGPNQKFDHRTTNGQEVDPNTELFVVSGEKLRFPGDPDASAGNTINCRCALSPVVVTSQRSLSQGAGVNGHDS